MLAIYQRRLVHDTDATSRTGFYRAIAEAVVARDRDRAAPMMAAHNRQSQQDVIAALTQDHA